MFLANQRQEELDFQQTEGGETRFFWENWKAVIPKPTCRIWKFWNESGSSQVSKDFLDSA